MRKILTVTFLTIVFCTPALADQITLKNGDRLTGKIVKSDGGFEKNDLILTTGLKIKLGGLK